MRLSSIQSAFEHLHPAVQDGLIGLGILGIHYAIYELLSLLGISPTLLTPLLYQLFEQLMHDPYLLYIKVHDLYHLAPALIQTIQQQGLQGTKQLVLTHVTAAMVTETLKLAVGRVRPNGLDNQSFPSGHTSRAFSSAAQIHQQEGLSAALPYYATASVIGCTRIYKNMHHPTDVFAGAAVGMLSAYAIHKTTQNQISDSGSEEYNVEIVQGTKPK